MRQTARITSDAYHWRVHPPVDPPETLDRDLRRGTRSRSKSSSHRSQRTLSSLQSWRISAWDGRLGLATVFTRAGRHHRGPGLSPDYCACHRRGRLSSSFSVGESIVWPTRTRGPEMDEEAPAGPRWISEPRRDEG
jgi:hypothetical protein